jgi:hypothetical protein
MVSEIIGSSLAIRTYGDNINYLEKEWSSKEVNNFKVTIELLRFFNSWQNPEKLKRNPYAT